ncbi:MAG: ATP-binding protein [Bacteroidales bacterium]|nr:ATP-binding protein [Bacteroidales bacterium]
MMYFSRQRYLNKLIAHKNNHLIKVITGIRRSGKSFLLFDIFYRHLRSEGVTDDHIIRIDLENRRNKSLRNPDALIAHIDSLMTDNDTYYIMLDEVQMVPEFEDVLNSYTKIDNADVYVTGSNSKFLSRDVITEFRGRGDEIHLYPLSVSEIAEAVPQFGWEQLWQQYLTYGGLPFTVQLQSDDEKSSYLKHLFRETYLRDIKERHNVRNDMALETILDIVSSSVGSLTNPSKLERTFNSLSRTTLSSATIKEYLGYLEDAFLIHRAMRFDIKGKKYISTPYKYYFSDIGLRNARLNFRQIEEPHIMENVIYNELLMRGYNVDVGVVELRQGDDRKQIEIDFVVNRGSQRYYIQSAYAIPSEEKWRQETRPLEAVGDSFKKIVIVKDDILLRHDDRGITTLGLRQFLLDENSINL